MNNEEKLIQFTADNYEKKITEINGHILHFLGYGHSNAIAIIANTSVILIDTLDSDARAERMKMEIKKYTDKPVKTIIYTHGHPDHRGGAGAFKETVEEIIAFTPAKPMLKYYDKLQDGLNQRGIAQHGYGLSDEEAICQGIGPREGKEVCDGQYAFLKPTTIYDEECVTRCIDGIPIEMVRAVGECDDGILIYLKDDQVICTGDNYYGCWPNLYAIRGTQYRDIAAWIETLDKMLSYDAEYLLPGHTKALIGKAEIKDVITTYRSAIESILMQTLDCINQGMTLDETVQAVKLDEIYQQKTYLGEYYGTVEWSVKSIYQGYVGWFDGDPVKLLPVSEKAFALELLTLINDDEKVMAHIHKLLAEHQFQIALQLIDLIMKKENNEELKHLKFNALMQRAKEMTSANARHYLIASAKNIR